MVNRYRVVLFALFGSLLLTVFSPPRPATPGPPFVDAHVPDVFTISPDGSFPCQVTLTGTGGPVVGAFVEVEFSVAATGLVAWTVPIPPGADIPITGPGGGLMFTGTTDALGQFTFHIAGGGCVAEKAGDVDPYTIQVRADNFVLDECLVNSPDAVDGNGDLPEVLGYSICDPATGTTQVGLADALFHTPPVKQGTVEVCTKFTEPFTAGVGLADASLMTPYVKGGTTGTCVYSGP